ncbi:DUF177 domain-containing protein [Bosea sp. (in: a-proteobacteria)]|uniref:YceD family protein n=1 Tax=Bosea sp. (in: a-proteobacteria) TaxID=1871050 RepID=UPI0027353054|nr:DUF177 domain-containing protein [Bosea sp. (in: a-proteobacteria)]MDP3409233.1 DUF177 domain-containing protein [Bosea sp. (in: a-proteobacteria)]
MTSETPPALPPEALQPMPPLPLQRPIRVDEIKLRGSHVAVRAEAAELAGIAAMLDLPSVESLEARYVLSRSGTRVKLEGEMKATLHQICAVTLDAFPVTLTVPLKLDFAPADQPNPRRKSADDDGGAIDVEVRLNEEDPPEPIVDGMIDLGAVTLEFLALGLDPYPRKPGAVFAEPAPEQPPESPFAALARLKRPE